MSSDDPATDPAGEAPRAEPPPDLPSTVVASEQNPPGTRRRRLVAPLATAAAVAVAVTGIGVGVVMTRGDDNAGDEPPALRLVDTAEGAGSGAPVAADAKPGVGTTAGLTITGELPTRPDRAAVWTLPDRVPTKDAVAALARQLGIAGAPERTSEGWQVGQGELVLQVSGGPGQPWQLGALASAPEPAPAMDCHVIIDGRRGCGQVEPGTGGGGGVGDRIPEQPQSGPGIGVGDTTKDPSSAESTSAPGNSTSSDGTSGSTASGNGSSGSAASGSGSSGSGSSGSTSSHGTQPVPPDQPTGTTRPTTAQPKPVERGPAESAVRGAAGPVLDALGLSDAQVQVSVQTWPGHGMVSADPVVGGMPVEGLTTRLGFDSDLRLTYGYGWLATPAAGREYPLVDARNMLERTMPQERTCEPCGSRTDERVRGGGVVTGATLGLDARWEDGTKLLLVPAWIYDVRFGTTKVSLSRIAVDPRYLAPPSGTKGRAVPVPGEPAESAGPSVEVSPAPNANTTGEPPASGYESTPVPNSAVTGAGPTGGPRLPVEPPATK